MAEETGTKKVNPVLEKHWEKIVLGVVVLLAVVFIGSQVSGGGNKAVKGLESAKANFKRLKDSTATGTIAAPKNDPPVNIPPVQTPDPSGPYTIGTKTKWIPDFRQPPSGPKAVFWLPKVTMNPPTPTFEGVKLSWALSGEPPASEDPKVKPPIAVKPSTFFFRIWRKAPGEEEKEIAKEVRGDAVEYIDTNTDPKKEYQYRIALGSNDPAWNAAVKNPKMLSTDPAQNPAPVSVRTLGIWSFEFMNHRRGDPDAEPPVPAEVWVKITKFDPEAGKVEWHRIHKLHQKQVTPLGFSEEDGKLTSIHPVTSSKVRSGRKVLVDFNSGAKILKINVERPVKYKYKVCDPQVVPGMGLVCKGPEEKEAEYRVNEVVYTDEEGKPQTDQKISGSGPHGDQLCPDHGGAAPPPPAPAPEAGTDRKKGDKDEEAGKMLDDADAKWQSAKQSDKKKAVELYQQLLKSFGDTEAVKSNRDRITERSKKKFD